LVAFTKRNGPDQTNNNEEPEPKKPDTSSTPGKYVPRVAILGVHGVGHHAAGETENAMADLLLSLPADQPNGPRYFDSFRAEGIQIPLQPLPVAKDPPAPKRGRLSRAFNLYEEQSARFSARASAYGQGKKAIPRGLAGDAFTQMLLQDYQGGKDGDAYVTTVLKGKRVAASVGGEADVHIYEVLWADLASPTNSFLSFFFALFQLLLHLGSLSRLAIDTGSAENEGPLWNLYLAVQRYAVRMLQIFLPLLKVILLICFLSCIPAVLNSGFAHGPLVPIGLCSLAGMVISVWLFTRKSEPVTYNPWVWVGAAVLPGVLGAAVGYLAAFWIGDRVIASSVACWILLGVPVFYYVMGKYEDIRKGVEITGWVLYALSFLTFVSILRTLKPHLVPQASLCVVELLVAAVRLSWMIMIAMAILALLFGSLVCLSEKDPSRRARLRAAVRTSRFALALPTVLFLLVTSAIWGSMFSIADRVRKPFFPEDAVKHQLPLFHFFVRLRLLPDLTKGAAMHDLLQTLVAWGSGYQLPVTLLLFSLAIFLLIWWALPAALTERFPLRDKQIPPRSSTNAESVRLGTWISRGLDATSPVTLLLWCSIFLAPPLFYVLHPKWQSTLEYWTSWIVWGAALGLSGAALAAVVRYGSPVLGIVLDVDTYLRTSPKDATPRARIVERYVSTLRHLARYRDVDGRGYDKLVIVSHSLGTLITTDLLRFLRAHGDPDLAAFGLSGGHHHHKISIELLTMGSPLRQLLNRFFPYLYDWVRTEPDNSLRPLPAPVFTPPNSLNPIPDPAELGARRWVNTYRSGDYVGRSLWLEEWYCRTYPNQNNNGRYPAPIYVASDGSRSEMCIGAGAHTHYWDDTAPDVAEVLSSMI